MLMPVINLAGPALSDPRSNATNVCSVQKRKMQTAIAPAVLAVRIPFCRRCAKTKGIHFMGQASCVPALSASGSILPYRFHLNPQGHFLAEAELLTCVYAEVRAVETADDVRSADFALQQWMLRNTLEGVDLQRPWPRHSMQRQPT